jgi:hypothetical protein
VFGQTHDVELSSILNPIGPIGLISPIFFSRKIEMKLKRLLIFCSLFAMACPLWAQQKNNADVPEIAEWEIQRRGNHVEMTGTIRAGLMAAALSPPADDSAKWYITLIYRPGEAKSEKMKSVLESSHEMKAWIDAGNSQRSTTHYLARSVDDRINKDWIEGLKTPLEKYGVPLIVLQPPANGRFGKHTTIVKYFFGEFTGKQLSDKLRDAIIAYVQAIDTPELRQSVAGIRSDGDIGVPPPFQTQPTVKPVHQQPAPAPVANVPVDFPPIAAQPLTMDEIQSACPGAEPEFLVKCLTEKDNSIDLVKLKWLIWQKDYPAKPVVKELPIGPPVIVEESGGLRTPARQDRDRREEETSNPYEPSAYHERLTTVAFLVVAFTMGWISARLKTILAARIAEGLAILDRIKMTAARSYYPDQERPGPIREQYYPSPNPVPRNEQTTEPSEPKPMLPPVRNV